MIDAEEFLARRAVERENKLAVLRQKYLDEAAIQEDLYSDTADDIAGQGSKHCQAVEERKVADTRAEEAWTRMIEYLRENLYDVEFKSIRKTTGLSAFFCPDKLAQKEAVV